MLHYRISKFEASFSCSLDPLCIIETTKWEGEDLHLVTEHYTWPNLYEKPISFHLFKEFEQQYGKLVSISPSKKYGLFVKRSTEERMTVLDFDNYQVAGHFQFSTTYPICCLDKPFSGFAWNESLSSILYCSGLSVDLDTLLQQVRMSALVPT